MRRAGRRGGSCRTRLGSSGRGRGVWLRTVRPDAFDGLNVAPDAFPDGLTDIVDYLVPELQERCVYPSAYPATTLRGNLGLPESVAHRAPGLAAERPSAGERARVA
ncbi:hypothetical protein [Pseudoclavibacter helvolus]|uniref:hypothetical protein n=1 Tax=Pseudoclavibacter helvolus TaxID=255205 RepID=UPI003736C867